MQAAAIAGALIEAGIIKKEAVPCIAEAAAAAFRNPNPLIQSSVQQQLRSLAEVVRTLPAKVGTA